MTTRTDSGGRCGGRLTELEEMMTMDFLKRVPSVGTLFRQYDLMAGAHLLPTIQKPQNKRTLLVGYVPARQLVEIDPVQDLVQVPERPLSDLERQTVFQSETVPVVTVHQYPFAVPRPDGQRIADTFLQHALLESVQLLRSEREQMFFNLRQNYEL
ncbi:MAG: hypothetical protein N3G75_09135 [Methanothrix sp.]|nr:hypothetical protein [Methanothrix sp.]MCX8207971.1 hypothetical protein [Methanothrix sp.]